MRTLLSPKWLLLHLVTVVVAVVMLGLARWQWGRAEATGSLRYYSYGVEWVLFAALTVFGYGKFALDERRPAEPAVRGDRWAAAPLPVPPAGDEDDPELVAYNRHLAWLAEHPRR